MTDKAHIGRSLRALRHMNRMTQQEVADGAGLSRTQITNIEKGRGDVPVKTLMRIADALGYEVRAQFVRKIG